MKSLTKPQGLHGATFLSTQVQPGFFNPSCSIDQHETRAGTPAARSIATCGDCGALGGARSVRQAPGEARKAEEQKDGHGIDDVFLEKLQGGLPSGYVKIISYWKWPFIVDFPIKNGDFP